MKILSELREAGRGRDMQALIDAIPYASFLGMRATITEDGLITELPFADHLVGNVNLPAVHGGAVGAFLEMTAVVQLLYDTTCERLPKTIDVSIDYLRSAGPETSHGRAIVTRHGRRVANVRVEMWQSDPNKPVAAAHGHFLLTRA